MKINAQKLSFKAIVPKANMYVQDKKTGKSVPVVFCEVNCKDKNDSQVFADLSKSWEYALCLKLSSSWKYENFEKGFSEPRGHYFLKNKNGEIIAICRTSDLEDSVRVDYLESKPESEYRFAGQMILAGIAKEAIKKGYDKMIVQYPVSGSDKFYEGACGFIEEDEIFVMGDKKLREFAKCKPNKRRYH